MKLFKILLVTIALIFLTNSFLKSEENYFFVKKLQISAKLIFIDTIVGIISYGSMFYDNTSKSYLLFRAIDSDTTDYYTDLPFIAITTRRLIKTKALKEGRKYLITVSAFYIGDIDPYYGTGTGLIVIDKNGNVENPDDVIFMRLRFLDKEEDVYFEFVLDEIELIE